MFLNSWSLALSVLACAVLLFAAVAGRTAWRVLRFWEPGSDSNRQIKLENEIWLSSALMEYAVAFQIVSLMVFVLAADAFCHLIIGAMCATGSLTANAYGMPALLVKLTGVFLYGFWIVLHQLDISVESYPLVRAKYLFFLVLLPVLTADILLQTLYLANLSPDIITSCCGVLFDKAGGGDANLIGSLDEGPFLLLFYSLASGLIVLGILLRHRHTTLRSVAYGFLWLVFLLLSLAGVTAVFSSYIYAMPYHHCPFCILKAEYGYIGFFLYGALLPAAFFGMTQGAGGFLSNRDELGPIARAFQRKAVTWSIILLVVFVVLSSWHMVLYRLAGGET